ncbi:MAG: hypothetical protein HKK66_05335 [Chlorobiaceae bacterium]|nr:hypothetical protein [Chlorobiaceae bacterium]
MNLPENMMIPSLYTGEEQAAIEWWIEHSPLYPERDDLVDSNKVAEIALYSIQEQLPQCITIREDGSKDSDRKYWDCSLRKRNVLLNPIHLFEINWADDSFPELLWPETYYATLLPGFDVYAVTFSQNSSDSYDYFDLAIGCFKVDKAEEIAEKAARSIQAWWNFQNRTWSQWAWYNVLKSGLINADLALRLRREVWKKVKKVETSCI